MRHSVQIHQPYGPMLRSDYVKGLEETLDIAERLNCRCLDNTGPGGYRAGRELQRKSLVEGLKACAPLLEKKGVTLVVEPLNLRVDHRGYFLSGSDEAAEIIKEVGSPNVKMLFDIYHQRSQREIWSGGSGSIFHI